MGAKQSFEEMEVWKAARSLTHQIYLISSRTGFERDWTLKDQIRRAAISIMANIAEGSERGTNKEFTHFLDYSISSCAEVKSHLYVALDLSYLDTDLFNNTVKQLDSISRQIRGFQKFLRQNDDHPAR